VNVVKRIRGIDVENLVKAGQLGAEQVAKLNAGLERPEAKVILREKINYDAECIPMVTNGKGLWLSVGFFTRIKTLDACEAACRNESFDEKFCPCKKHFEKK